MGKTEITVEAREHVLLIGLNRSAKMNAMNRAMYHGIAAAYGLLDRDPDLRVGLVHAAGQHFTAGLELDDWVDVFAGGSGIELDEGEIDPFGIASDSLSKPLVFATQGICFTCGVELMLNADIRIAASNVRYAQLEVQRGIFPCGGATFRLPEEIGWANAQRYLLTGDEWSGAQALEWGLIQDLVEPEALFDQAWLLARKVAQAAPLGVQGSLRSSRLARLQGHKAASEALFPALVPVMQSEDAEEGVRSFLQRRKAEFKGR